MLSLRGLPQNVQSEFRSARALLRPLDPKTPEAIHPCLEQLQQAFSPETQAQYRVHIDAFLTQAQHRLTRRLEDAVARALEPKREREEIGKLTAEMKVGGVDVREKGEALSQRSQRKLPLELKSCLQHLIHTGKGSLEEQEPEKSWREDLAALNEQCEEYRRMRLEEGESKESVDEAIQEVKARADEFIEEMKKQCAEIEKRYQDLRVEMRSVILNVGRSKYMVKKLFPFAVKKRLVKTFEFLKTVELLQKKNGVSDDFSDRLESPIFQDIVTYYLKSLPVKLRREAYDWMAEIDQSHYDLLFLPPSKFTQSTTVRSLSSEVQSVLRALNRDLLSKTRLQIMSEDQYERVTDGWLSAYFLNVNFEELAEVSVEALRKIPSDVFLAIVRIAACNVLSARDLTIEDLLLCYKQLRAQGVTTEEICAVFDPNFGHLRPPLENPVAALLRLPGPTLQKVVSAAATVGVHLLHFNRNTIRFFGELSREQIIEIGLAHRLNLLDHGTSAPSDYKVDALRGFLAREDRFTQYLQKFDSLSIEDRYLVATIIQPRNWPLFFYCSEAVGKLEHDIQTVPLAMVPTEPLIRFISSKPFAEIQEWLAIPISTPEGIKPRIQTVSEEQKRTILRRFLQTHAVLPLPMWMKLFAVTLDEAKQICRREEEPLSPELEAYHSELQKLDSNDPPSVFMFQRERSRRLWSRIIPDLLLNARVVNICDGRTVLTWGNCSPTSSLCVAQDSAPLHARYNGQPILLHQKNMFGDFNFDVAAYTLRKRLLALKESSPEGFRRVVEANNPSDLTSPEETELFLELQRIGKKLFSQYGDTFWAMHSSFSDWLKGLYKSMASRYAYYDHDSFTHRHAIAVETLVGVLRYFEMTREADLCVVTLRGRTLYHLRELLPKGELVIPKEENPGIEDLETVATNYRPHTLSPLTPMAPSHPAHLSISPSELEESVTFLKSLTNLQMRQISDRMSLFCAREFADTTTTETYCEEWAKTVFPEVDLSAASRVLIELAKQYVMFLDKTSTPILPNKVYRFDPRGVDEFGPTNRVPGFLREQGNFASIICTQFIPHETERHDGNCAVNSFLLGLHGPHAYAAGGRNLSSDIRDFREAIVAYAQAHEDAVIEQYGRGQVAEIISKYSSPDYIEWTTRPVWDIAARIFNVPIRVFFCDGHRGFRTNVDRQVVPFDEETECFNPPAGREPPKPTVDLILWGPHYAYLEPRPRT